eukprot:1160065-Pelagomonas_calceolata.AAC.7
MPSHVSPWAQGTRLSTRGNEHDGSCRSFTAKASSKAISSYLSTSEAAHCIQSLQADSFAPHVREPACTFILAHLCIHTLRRGTSAHIHTLRRGTSAHIHTRGWTHLVSGEGGLDDHEVFVSGGQHPLAIVGDVDGGDGGTQARNGCVCPLQGLVAVQPHLAVLRAYGDYQGNTRGDQKKVYSQASRTRAHVCVCACVCGPG